MTDMIRSGDRLSDDDVAQMLGVGGDITRLALEVIERRARDGEPFYQRGMVSLDLTRVEYDPLDCVFGVQVNHDGRVWVCLNSQTFLRFKPVTPRIG